MRKTAILVLTLMLVFSLSLGVMAQDEKSPEEELEEVSYGGTLRLAETQSPEGMFNPLFSETTYDSDIVALVFEGLTTVDENYEPQPALAQDWEVSDDNLTYTFYLDEEAEFHDGEPVTAEDVEYTFEMFLHPDYAGVRGSNFEPILGAKEYRDGEADDVRGIEVVDEHTIEITLEDTYAPLLVQTTTFGIVPEHILSEYEPDELDEIDFNQDPVGSGPFEFVEYSADEYTRVEAFEDYREGRPYLDNVVWNYIDEQSMVMQLERGEIDYGQILAEDYDRVKELDNVTMHPQIRNGFGYLAFNLNRDDSPVSERAVRQAIAYGSNRTGFHEEVMNGLAVNVNSPISQASWAYTDDLKQYEHDPDKAQEILEDNGWEMEDGVYHKDGEPLSFTINISSGSQFIDQLVALTQDNLNSIGFDVEVEKMEFNTLREDVDDGELDCWFMGWSFGADPDPYNTWHTEGDWNDTGFGNDETDELIEEARSTLDRYERRKLYVEFQEIWNKSMPYLPMYADIYVHAINDRVRGFDPDPGTTNPFHEWDLLKEAWIPEDERK